MALYICTIGNRGPPASRGCSDAALMAQAAASCRSKGRYNIALWLYSHSHTHSRLVATSSEKLTLVHCAAATAMT